MQISSALQESFSPDGTPLAIFVIYLNTQETNTDKDYSYSAIPFDLIFDKEPEEILSHVIPMISELVYQAYGREVENKQPITNIHATGFDPSCVNGMPGAKM
jgi:hypothetical protein